MPAATSESLITLACLQMQPDFGKVEANLIRSLDLIGQAHTRGAQMVVLPELCNTGYVFQSRTEAFALAETLEGPSISAWCDIARRLDMTLVAGFTEKDGHQLYNSAVLIDARGVVGRYRKLHLWGNESLFFEPGNLSLPVFAMPFGRIACAICYDMWFPETFRLAALQGADLLCVPTNWVPMNKQPENLTVMANILAMSGAHSNSLFVAAADRVGTERDQPFLGRSLIVDSNGWPVAGPASEHDEEIIMAQVNLSTARKNRQLNGFNHLLRDRRTDLYADMLGRVDVLHG